IGATPKMLADYSSDRVRNGFPEGVKQVAGMLRAGTTYYNVIVGDRMYHLIYWDGAQWSMLGRLWRDLDTQTAIGVPSPPPDDNGQLDFPEAPTPTPPPTTPPPSGDDAAARAARLEECSKVVDHILGIMRR